jgi:hypothetical protein
MCSLSSGIFVCWGRPEDVSVSHSTAQFVVAASDGLEIPKNSWTRLAANIFIHRLLTASVALWSAVDSYYNRKRQGYPSRQTNKSKKNKRENDQTNHKTVGIRYQSNTTASDTNRPRHSPAIIPSNGRYISAFSTRTTASALNNRLDEALVPNLKMNSNEKS